MILIYSPKEQFQLYKVISKIDNKKLYILIVKIKIYVFATNKKQIIPNNKIIIGESLIRSIEIKIKNYGKSNKIRYLPKIYLIFIFILFSNIIGLVPYSTTPTVSIFLTLKLSIILIIGFYINGLIRHGIKLLAIYLPSGTPSFLIPIKIILEIIAFISKILSLGLRLGINLIVGHLLLKVIIGGIYYGYMKGKSKKI